MQSLQPEYTRMPEDMSMFPSSISNVSLGGQSTTSTTSSKSAHNPYSLTHWVVEFDADGHELDHDSDDARALDGSPDSSMHRGTMVLLKEDDGKEVVLSKAEVVKRMRRTYGYVDSEVATPCFHFGRCRLRYKNSITHCRCRTCGLKWREIAYSRIRPDQMEEFQRSFTASKADSRNKSPNAPRRETETA